MSPFDELTRARDAAPERAAAPVGTGDLVTPVHACIPGRVRWHVRGLRGDPALQRVLEAGLAELPGIHAACASVDTGNLLTRFDPGVAADRIGDRIAALVRGDIVPVGGELGATPDWHARPADAIADALHASRTDGLTPDAARERLAGEGANVLPPTESRSGLGIFVGQFQTLPVGLLALAGGFSLVTGGVAEAVAILAVLALNATLGTAVESRSERTIRSLGATGPESVQVVRGGVVDTIAPAQLVPGDLIVLRQGMVVPADARVSSARALRVSEAMLTGESLPVEKHAEPVGRATPLSERLSMVYRGTAVTGGSGTAIVVATGPRTEIGRIQRLVGDTRTRPTPLQNQLDRLGRQLVWASLAACAAVVGVGALRGVALFQLIRLGVSLAVAAVPEGLPTVATTTLALGIEDMRRRGVLVRRLDAVETLASVNVVCFDKTGTLTLNQMRVIEVACGDRPLRAGPDGPLRDEDGTIGTYETEPDGPLAWLLRVGALCSDAELEERNGTFVLSGSATEGALVRLALDCGLDVPALRAAHPRLAVRHRSAGYRFMATVHDRPGDPDGALVAVKGSPAEVLDLCAWEICDGGRRTLAAHRRAAILRANDAMADQALRVLGFAFTAAGADRRALTDGDAAAMPIAGLTWVGLAGMADPVRPGMTALMRTLHDAGLRTVMMTGDQVATARAVARQLGLAGSGTVAVLDVGSLDPRDGDALAASVRRAHVFARVSPAQKLLIVRALQAAGEHVAMTGDGINDSPALKIADVGIAMGGAAGSEAAREVADVVLRTDDLATLAVAVEQGRTTNVNVRKSIRYLLATNLSEILMVLGATAAGFGEPLTAMQLLWINLVSDVLPGLGLAFEPPEPDTMRTPPHAADAEIVDRDALWRLGMEGGTIAASSLGALAWGAARHGAGVEARTMAFGSLVTAQLLHALSVRSDRAGLFSGGVALPPNRPLTGLLLGSAVLQALALLVPGVRGTLGVVPLGPLDLAITATAGLLPGLLNEAIKAAQPAGSVDPRPLSPRGLGPRSGPRLG